MMQSPKSTKKDWNVVFWAILLIGFAFRFILLNIKPPHFDEGINGWFVDQMIKLGYYRYDPTNYHGPLHFYILLFFKTLMGRNLWALRVSASAFGFASIYLLLKLEKYLGRPTAYLAAFFCAISPGMIFYSRYSIHETELLFFSLLALDGYFRHQLEADKKSLWLMGIGLAGMIVTKETFFVHAACFILAILSLRFYEKFFPSTDRVSRVNSNYLKSDLYRVIGANILIIYLFYSGFTLHNQGAIDFFKAFAPWFQTGTAGNGHGKPFEYWGKLFFQYEGAAFAGILSLVFLLPKANQRVRLIGIYGIGIFLAYSIVNYKTPWCIIELIWPFHIVFAYCLVRWASLQKTRKIYATLLVSVFAIPSIAKSVTLNFRDFVDEKEPYVYVQTFSPIMEVMGFLNDLVAHDPSKQYMPISIYMESSWPLPWLLGDFTSAGYPSPTNISPQADAPLILIDSKSRFLLETKLKNKYFTKKFRLRSAQDEVMAYFDQTVFKNYFEPKADTFLAAPAKPIKAGEGLRARYFANGFGVGEPVKTEVMPVLDFFWEDSNRPLPPPFSISFDGEINIPENGSTEFFLASDDGSELYIDDRLIIDNKGAHATKTVNQSADLKKGWHRILVKYNDFGGGMMLRLMWKHQNSNEELIPSSSLRVTKKQIRKNSS